MIRTEGGWYYIALVAGMTAWFIPASAEVWHDGNARMLALRSVLE